MTRDNFEQFEKALNCIAAGYLYRIEGTELATYYQQLTPFPIEVVSQALSEAPDMFPTWFPKVGELAGICRVISAKRCNPSTPGSVAISRAMAECSHDYRFQPEPAGGLYAGFDECAKCGLAKPHISAAANPVQASYLSQAINAPEESYERDAA